MIEALIEQLRSNSLHARYGAIKALRGIGPVIIDRIAPLVTSSYESDLTRLSALEAVRPFYCFLNEEDLVAFSALLMVPHSAALKIEIIKLLELCRYVEAPPVIRGCIDDAAVDERVCSWGFGDEEDTVSAYASKAIATLEPLR